MHSTDRVTAGTAAAPSRAIAADLQATLPRDAGLAARLLALNNAHARELSLLDAQALQDLVATALYALGIGRLDAALIAFDQDAPYASPNFRWFAERHARFVYVDRIVVAPAARGAGHARALYDHLFAAARAAGHDRITCEINSDPPNPASLAFHEALGFARVGRARLANGKTVDYFERPLWA
ncbi:GNAT family N-acetyltransferase [Novosphingobium sp. 1949]|uniref:GNAT family N-acetyltransferase n=1 Tax=Novosphingobium organovorum TaxID=2930092 RepID=A0ABT0BAT7_9SPHN|nr:GNAT family N-acetyltransferase [Novosphingobium organovorum]MCJ2182064.1 GNAT family N-acetyltransferase [Novosphingobium organovorum]